MNPQNEPSPVGLKNWIAFIAFTMVVVFGWQLLFPPPPPAEPTPSAPPITGAPAEGAPLSTAMTPPTIGAGETPAATTETDAAATTADATERLSIRTPHARVEVTNVGGRVTSWQLPDHPGYWTKDEPLDLVLSPTQDLPEGEKPTAPAPVRDDAPLLPLQVLTGDEALDARLAEALHELSVEPSAEGQRLSMRWSDGQGTVVEKSLTFREDVPVAVIEARLWVGGVPRSFRLAWGPGIGDHSPAERDNMYFRRGRLVYRAGEDVEHVEKPKKAAQLPNAAVDFAGLEDSFFTAIFIPGAPEQPGRPSLRAGFVYAGSVPNLPNGKKGPGKNLPEYIRVEAPFSPSAPVQSLYVGARNADVLERVDALFDGYRNLAEVPKLGAFIGPIARFMRTVLIWLQGHVGNWGVAIICLTLLIRGVLFPLTHVSLKKMRLMQDKMKIAKPRIDAIKAKYRKMPRDLQTRQREQQDTMAVYKEVGLNPADQLMGCLPLLISMPFFFALFRLLQEAPEFRHQPFLGWSNLSAADPTKVWPILTGATTFLSQKLGMSQSSGGSSEMESVQRNMLFMFPIMFVVFCWSAPLGLVVYWTTNNIVQIGQQYLLKIMLPPPPTDASSDSGKKNKSKRKASGSQSKSEKTSGSSKRRKG